MKNYRYVSQGEYYFTEDPNTVLITSGMTECIAINIVTPKNPLQRLVSHFDGFILWDANEATENIKKCLNKFATTNPTTLQIYLLGGQKNLRICKNLYSALEGLNLKVTSHIDAMEFCAKLEKETHQRLNPTNAGISLVSENSKPPHFVSYSPLLFESPFSEEDLEEGKGLISEEEKVTYQRFVKANDNILTSYTSLARKLRDCNDIKLIEEYENKKSPNQSNIFVQVEPSSPSILPSQTNTTPTNKK